MINPLRIEIIVSNPLFTSEQLSSLLAGSICGDVDIVLTDPGFLRILNKRYRHIDKPTDVLTFDLADRKEDIPEGVIYVDGRLFPPMNALLERILHGYLHLMGYVHNTKEEMDNMNLKVGKMLVNIHRKHSL